MDEAVRLFFDEMGTPIAQKAVPTSSIVRYSKYCQSACSIIGMIMAGAAMQTEFFGS